MIKPTVATVNEIQGSENQVARKDGLKVKQRLVGHCRS